MGSFYFIIYLSSCNVILFQYKVSLYEKQRYHTLYTRRSFDDYSRENDTFKNVVQLFPARTNLCKINYRTHLIPTFRLLRVKCSVTCNLLFFTSFCLNLTNCAIKSIKSQSTVFQSLSNQFSRESRLSRYNL